MDTTY